MNSKELIQLHDQYVMSTYGRYPVALESGRGAVAVDMDGKEYVDFGSGIGANSLGYCDAGWVKAVTEQLGKIQHGSNYYYNQPSALAAQKLCEVSGYDKLFFCNSGAEANECAIKIARKYSFDKYGKGRATIVSLKNSFHGRTVTTLSATGQDEFHRYFYPFTEGFAYAAPRMDEVEKALDGSVCAVMLEFIQGEGGVIPLEQEFVSQLFETCRKRDILVLADEVQTGVGRTGTFYCFEQYGVRPDVATSAKGLGAGLPIGVCLCSKELSGVLSAGTHGSTFGGNPVVCAGALEVLNRVSEPNFLNEVQAKGMYLRNRLEDINAVESVRGKGLMLGAMLKDGTLTAKEAAARCLEKGLFVLTAKTALRFLPPLTISYEELDRGATILEEVLGG